MVNVSSRLNVLLIGGLVFAPLCAPSAFAQSVDSKEAQYHALLQNIADTQISIARQEAFVAGQVEKLNKIDAQKQGLEDLKAFIGPMVEKMTAELSAQITSDYPFAYEERMARLEKLKDVVGDAGIPIADKYRRVLSVYEIEVNYGNAMESYQGDHPVSPTNRTGDDRYKKDEAGKIVRNKSTGQPIEVFDGTYLRFGRMSFVYVNEDGSDPLRYDLKTSKWVSVAGNRAALVRQAVRVSRGEVAPRVVFAPVSPMP